MNIIPVNGKKENPPMLDEVILGINFCVITGIVLGTITDQWVLSMVAGFGFGLLVGSVTSLLRV